VGSGPGTAKNTVSQTEDPEEIPVMQRASSSILSIALVASMLLAASAGCGSEEKAAPKAAAPAKPAPSAPAESVGPTTPDDLPNALVLSLAGFAAREPGSRDLPKPLPARMEFIYRQGGEWKVAFIDDSESNVFHKAMYYETPKGEPRILSMAGSEATVKLWEKGAGGYTAETLWRKDFGGKFSRMRDTEVADLFADGSAAFAVATHDQGVVATIRPKSDNSYEVKEIDAEPDTFVHEIEIGDVNGDGDLEVYATPSEPNRLDGSHQSGQVVRYVPKTGEGRVVVADLKDRHAKEIYVGDVDQNGTDELYVVVEGRVNKGTKDLEVPVHILRYEADTDPAQGVVIGEIPDRLCRFITVGDIDGDGTPEMVAAAFSSGLWLLRPNADPMQPWNVSSIDKDSGGFEHAAILTDLDGDGKSELYVASDNHKEVRRYVWDGSKLVRETIYRRDSGGGGVFTWNIMPVPVAMVP
jgi:hypothetical protein